MALTGLPGGNTVDEHAQRPLRCDLGIFLAQRTSCGVARIGKGVLAGVNEARVEISEVFQREEDLPADFDLRRRRISVQFHRNVFQRADVRRDVFAGVAVTACGCAHQFAVAVEQIARQTVDLHFRQKLRAGWNAALDPGEPGVEFFDGEDVVQRIHASHVVDRCEGFCVNAAADFLGG